jgi:transposase
MLTAVIERDGSIVRYNSAFLNFLRQLKTVSRACNIRAPQEKGKVEGVIHYIRYNFWPLRPLPILATCSARPTSGGIPWPMSN